jgi:hypothetical protein
MIDAKIFGGECGDDSIHQFRNKQMQKKLIFSVEIQFFRSFNSKKKDQLLLYSRPAPFFRKFDFFVSAC